MSESRVSSVIQEWAYPGQAHPQTHNPAPSSHGGSSGQLHQIDMIPYSQSQGPVRGGADDRVAEQMMGLSYQPYPSSCLRTPIGGNSNQQQNHSSAQQVKILLLPSSDVTPSSPPSPCRDITQMLIFSVSIFVFSASRTSLCSFFHP